MDEQQSLLEEQQSILLDDSINIFKTDVELGLQNQNFELGLVIR